MIESWRMWRSADHVPHVGDLVQLRVDWPFGGRRLEAGVFLGTVSHSTQPPLPYRQSEDNWVIYHSDGDTMHIPDGFIDDWRIVARFSDRDPSAGEDAARS